MKLEERLRGLLADCTIHDKRTGTKLKARDFAQQLSVEAALSDQWEITIPEPRKKTVATASNTGVVCDKTSSVTNNAITNFAERMQFKLDKNKHKSCDIMNTNGDGRSWNKCDIFWLLFRLREETLELEEALRTCDFLNAQNEAADVGNFAMMIFDNIKKLAK